jgi:hypothetical protein
MNPSPVADDLTSILILCCNQLDYTRLCLQHVLRHTPVAGTGNTFQRPLNRVQRLPLGSAVGKSRLRGGWGKGIGEGR